MEDAAELNAVRHALSDMQAELSEVSRIAEYPSTQPRWWTGRDHPMMVPNPAFIDLSKRYWEVGRKYRGLHTRYTQGQRQGLWREANLARAECLEMREDLLALLRQKLQPSEEPAR